MPSTAAWSAAASGAAPALAAASYARTAPLNARVTSATDWRFAALRPSAANGSAPGAHHLRDAVARRRYGDGRRARGGLAVAGRRAKNGPRGWSSALTPHHSTNHRHHMMTADLSASRHDEVH